MTIAIIAAMEQEAQYLRESLTEKQEKYFLGQSLTTGLLNGIHVVVSESGIGKVNAAKTTALICARFLPRAVINTGSAGGIQTGLHQGDVIIGQEVAHHDVDVTAFGYQFGQVPRLEPRFKAHPKLALHAEKAAPTLTTAFVGGQVKQGLIVSGDSFVHTAVQREKILQHFPDALAVEMEGVAIAQVCQALEVPCLIIRAISDLANDSSALSFDEFLSLAAERSAKMVAQLVANIGLERLI